MVVGAGQISRAWFPPLLAEGVEVVSVVDLNLQSAQGRIDEYGLDCKASCDLSKTLRHTTPDFVLDLTVPEAHCKVTCTALRAGCHVIGEKPMASNMAQARRMVQTAEETGRLYMVSQSRRWNTNHETTKHALAGGKIGKLTMANCDFYIGAHFDGFRTDMPSPLILDMAIHHFDLVRFFTGADPVAVYAHEFNPAGSWYRGNAAASCIFEMTDGVVFTYRGSWCAEGFSTSWNGDWRIVGENGTLVLSQDQTPQCQIVAGGVGFQRKLKELRSRAVKCKYESMHGALREMLGFLSTGRIPQTTCQDNIKSLAMVFAALESSRKRRRVELKLA